MPRRSGLFNVLSFEERMKARRGAPLTSEEARLYRRLDAGRYSFRYEPRPWPDAKIAQCAVYWLGGMRQADVAARVAPKNGPTEVCRQLTLFLLKWHPSEETAEAKLLNSGEDRKPALAEALASWMQSLPDKPKLRAQAALRVLKKG